MHTIHNGGSTSKNVMVAEKLYENLSILTPCYNQSQQTNQPDKPTVFPSYKSSESLCHLKKKKNNEKKP